MFNKDRDGEEKERDKGERERERGKIKKWIKNNKERIFKWSVKKIKILMEGIL